ncbi:hypothetical protein Tco_1302823 [Tanacetum coccineum]
MAHSIAVMVSGDLVLKTSTSYNWRNLDKTSNYEQWDSTFIRSVKANGPQGRPKPAKAWASKDETNGIHRVKIIRSDNGTGFKNRDMLEFCGNKGIKQ